MLEAVLKQARTTRHPWLIACDANMCPEDFEKSLWFQKGADACGGPERSFHVQVEKGTKDERTYDYVVASCSLEGKISQMEVVEDF